MNFDFGTYNLSQGFSGESVSQIFKFKLLFIFYFTEILTVFVCCFQLLTKF